MERHVDHLLACDANVGFVVSMAQAQGCIDHDGEEGVHGANVVQHVAVLKGHTDQHHQEVQTPHHLTEPTCPIEHGISLQHNTNEFQHPNNFITSTALTSAWLA